MAETTLDFEFASEPTQDDFLALAEFIETTSNDRLTPALLERREAVVRECRRMAMEPVTEAIAARYQSMRLFVQG